MYLMWCAVGTSPASSTVDHDPEKSANALDSSALPAYHGNGEAICPGHTTEAKLVRKIDLRVIPFLSILYLLGLSCHCYRRMRLL